MHIRLDSTNYELYTDGDGGKNGPIIETGHIEWERGTFTKVGDTLILTSSEPKMFNSMRSLKLLSIDHKEPGSHYFIEEEKPERYWKVVWVSNKGFHQKIFQGGICK
ncbi:hypothetical protein [Brumimicrobium sp.]|uniref:hypothetical protein n=1 Tax=Brumimicrobium sp. TaxID=2029867 RepID=UPI003A8C9819